MFPVTSYMHFLCDYHIQWHILTLLKAHFATADYIIPKRVELMCAS